MRILLLVPTLLEASFLPGFPELSEVLAGPVVSRRFDMALTGLGPLDAGVAASRYLALASYDRCVLVGLAGGFAGRSPAAPALVEARHFIMEGLGVRSAEGVRPFEELDFPESVRGPLPRASREEVTAVPTGLPEVSALTVCSSSASSVVAQERMRSEPDVQIEEMEGFAVARACRLAAVPLTCLRAVSNEAGDRDKSRWFVQEAMALIQQQLESLLP